MARRSRVLSNFFSVINRRYKCRLRRYPLYHLLVLPASPHPHPFSSFPPSNSDGVQFSSFFRVSPYDGNDVTVKIIFPMIQGYLYRASGRNKSGARSNFSDAAFQRDLLWFPPIAKKLLKDVLVGNVVGPRNIALLVTTKAKYDIKSDARSKGFIIYPRRTRLFREYVICLETMINRREARTLRRSVISFETERKNKKGENAIKCINKEETILLAVATLSKHYFPSCARN